MVHVVTRSDSVIVCLPGILARCEEQHRPLWLERYGEVKYLDYATSAFVPEPVIANAVSTVKSFARVGRKVCLLGSSLGGNVAAFATQQLRQDCPDLNDWFSAILVDAPAGSRTFTAAQSVPPGLITSAAGTVIFSVIGGVSLFVSRQGPGLPKDEYITRPSADVMDYLAGRRDFTDEAWRQWVKQTAKQFLTGHSGKAWAEQLRWMTNVYEDGSLDAAASSMKGLSVTYIQCTYGNDVVTQPQAQQWWLERLGSVVQGGMPAWRTVEAPHCGYLQMQAEFELKIAPLLS